MSDTPSSIRPLATSAAFELSHSQLMIWVGQKANPEAPLYNMVHAFSLKEDLDLPLFKEAYGWFVANSDTMRAVITENGGRPSISFDGKTKPISLVDLSESENPEAACTAWIDERKGRPFDLSSTLSDSAIIKKGDADYVWYLNQHHVITDAWSFTLVYRNVLRAYRAMQQGDEPQAPPQFRGYLQQEPEQPRRRTRDYWAAKAASLPARPALYGTGSSTATNSTRISIDLGEDRSSRIRKLAESEALRSITPDLGLLNVFATTLAAFVARVSEFGRTAIGTPAHGRVTKAFQETPGLFIEFFPLVVDVNPGDSFLELALRTKTECAGFFKHARPGYSLPAFVRDIPVTLNYINAQFEAVDGMAVNSRWIHPDASDPQHAIRLQVHDFNQSGQIRLDFDLNNDLFDERSRTRIAYHFLTLLDAFLDDPETLIKTPDLLSGEERAELKALGTGPDLPGQEGVIDMLRSAFEAHADTVAIQQDDKTRTFAELDLASDHLAAEIESRVPVDGSIAIYLDRSAEFVLAVVASIKSGRPYIPIDRNYPGERVHFMLVDSGASLLLTDADLPTDTPTLSPSFAPGASEPGSGSEGSRGEGELAYIMYTSGSTGKPKGVCVSHRSLADYLRFARHEYTQGRPCSCPLFTSVSFDLTVTSLFLPIITGGTLHVYPPSSAQGDLSIFEIIENRNLDLIKLTPSHLALLADLRLDSLRVHTLILGGENLTSALARKALSRFSSSPRLFNEYGPTEATVGCAIHPFDPEIDTGDSVSIGKPAPNATIWILDDESRLLPRGMAGELCVTGVGLASEYLNRPELTAQRFIETREFGRVYRTGDLARWDENGRLAFLGRVDDQTKIRGVRIEPAEIEGAITSFPGISGVSVVPVRQSVLDDTDRQDTHAAEEVRLAAYFVADGQIEIDTLRVHLASRLPANLIPSHFLQIEAIPLSHNGKVDTDALPDPGPQRPTLSSRFVEPEKEVDRTLASIWAETLRLERVGIEDNFFDLGGDSITAIQIVARARERGIPLTPAMLFEHQTIRELASVSTADVVVVHADQGPVTGPVPLTPIQQWFLQKENLDQNAWTHSVLLNSATRLDPGNVSVSLQRLLTHHDSLRISLADGVQTVTAPNAVDPGVEIETRSAEIVEAQLLADISLAEGRLVRAAILRRDAGDQLLVLAHHIAVDAVSWTILLEDLAALLSGNTSLRAKTSSFKEWSTMLNASEVAKRLDEEAPYWRAQVEQPAPPIPVDHGAAEDHHPESSSEFIVVSLDSAKTSTLLTEAPRMSGHRVQAFLLTAVAQALTKWTGGPVRIDLEGHGREVFEQPIDLTRTTGWFTSLYPIHIDLTDTNEPVRLVSEQLNETPGTGAGFGLHVRRDTNPTFATAPFLFNYLGRFDAGTDRGLSLARPLILHRSPDATRSHAIEINAVVFNDELQIEWRYSRLSLHAKTIQRLANDSLDSLHEMLSELEAGANAFPLANLDAEKMQKLANLLGRESS